MKRKTTLRYFLALGLLLLLLCPTAALARQPGSTPETVTEVPYYGPDKPDDSYILGDTINWIVRGINSWAYRDALRMFAVADLHQIRHIVIHLNSEGGSVMDGMALGMLLREKVQAGWTIEVRAQGFVASAAVIVLVTGSPGQRYLHEDSLVMVHEIAAFTFMEQLKTTDARKKADYMALIERTMTGFVARYTKLSTDELLVLMRAETWMTADQAVAKGFADHLVGH